MSKLSFDKKTFNWGYGFVYTFQSRSQKTTVTIIMNSISFWKEMYRLKLQEKGVRFSTEMSF